LFKLNIFENLFIYYNNNNYILLKKVTGASNILNILIIVSTVPLAFGVVVGA
jgi:hypothetical protein